MLPAITLPAGVLQKIVKAARMPGETADHRAEPRQIGRLRDR